MVETSRSIGRGGGRSSARNTMAPCVLLVPGFVHVVLNDIFLATEPSGQEQEQVVRTGQTGI